MGFCPRDLMTVPSSLVVMVPSPSLSNKEKASLNSVRMRMIVTILILNVSILVRFYIKTIQTLCF